jgi:hypothetical protein
MGKDGVPMLRRRRSGRDVHFPQLGQSSGSRPRGRAGAV